MRAWRRLHAPDVIAQVEPLGGFGTWKATVWHTSAPGRPVSHPRTFQLLTDAQHVADALACTEFGHCCDGLCGKWLARAG
jgi:hypothetical protein